MQSHSATAQERHWEAWRSAKIMKLPIFFFLFIIGSSVAFAQQAETSVTSAIQKVITDASAIKPGEKQAVLMTGFTTKGGFSYSSSRKYVSVRCVYIKFDVTFRPKQTGKESDGDIILAVSKPYLELPITGS